MDSFDLRGLSGYETGAACVEKDIDILYNLVYNIIA